VITATLIDELLDGESGWSIELQTVTGIVNERAVVRRADGQRVVVRRYLWPFGHAESFDRAAKEEWLLPRLAGAGVPVPRVLASARPPGDRPAILLSWLPGRALGEVARSLDDTDLRSAWAAAGAALRACHQADLGVPLGVGGMVVAGAVSQWPEGSWGGWHVNNTHHHADRVLSRAARRAGGVTVEACVALAEAARAHLDGRPVRPIHSDAHAWNVLVERDGSINSGWRCTGWLDWEFSWAADPRYDLMRARNASLADIGPTPKSFERGTGLEPDELVDAVYDLGFWLWMAGDDLDGTGHLPVAYAQAWRWLKELSAHLRALENLLGR
jgi:aminoglycoside phosphotransferase (APT) family kinase protein